MISFERPSSNTISGGTILDIQWYITINTNGCNFKSIKHSVPGWHACEVFVRDETARNYIFWHPDQKRHVAEKSWQGNNETEKPQF